MSTKTKGNQNGHSGSQEVETLISEMKIFDSRDYSEHATVYKIRGARTSGGPLHLEIGDVTRILINEGVRMAYLMDKSVTPLPLELVICDDETKIFCGRQFEIEKDMSNTQFGNRIKEVMSEHNIGFVAVMRNGWDSNVYVSFGRGDEAEFFASVHYIFPSSTDDEEVL